MVLNSTRPRGAAEDPDKVLASPARWTLLALFGFVCVAGAAIAAGGAFAPLAAGESRSAAAVLAGIVLAVAGGAGVVILAAPRGRRPLPPAHSAEERGVVLPVRTSYRAARVVALVAVAAFGVVLLALSGTAAGRILGVAVALVGLAFAVLSARATPTIGLDPDGVTLPAGVTPREHIAWGDVVEVAVVGGWQPMLIVAKKGPGLAACRILAQAWPPSALVAAVEHFQKTPRDRARLTDPDVLDEFRR